MALTPKLQLRQSQSLVMTPQLMQAIKLLQLSSLDLAAYVDRELEQNPLLELHDGQQAAPEASGASSAEREGDQSWGDAVEPESRSSIEARLDTDFGNVFPDDAPQSAERPTLPATPEPGDWSGLGAGGAYARIPADATAYAHRSETIMLNVAAFYEGLDDKPAKQAWVDEFAAALNPKPGAYVNFIADEGAGRVRAAYPDATRTRLRRIKAHYDPQNLFRLNQNIPPA